MLDFCKSDVAGIPAVYYFGQDCTHNILVMELLERNLETVFAEETNSPNKAFSMMTILLIADQMVSPQFILTLALALST